MARKRRILVGQVAQDEPKSVLGTNVVKKPKVTSWERACMTGNYDALRRKLTKTEYREYCELRFSLKVQAPGILIDGASLDTLREFDNSVRRLQILRLSA